MDSEEWFNIEMDAIGDESIYSEEGRERLVEDEELSLIEDAFMQGYESAFD